MPIPELAAAISTVKGAIEAGKAIAGASTAIEVGTLKMHAADLMGRLATAQVELLSVHDAVRAKEIEIKELQEALELKATLVRKGNAYYAGNAEGAPYGDPFCQRCWEVDHKLRHLSLPARTSLQAVCPQCKATYDPMTARRRDANGN